MRARNIKPGLFSNEILGKADPLLTILFASLWCHADKEGRLEDRPERIGAATFPYRKNIDTAINGYLDDLQQMGFITRYVEQGKKLIQVIEFQKHQRPHHTEKNSVLPAMTANSLILKGSKKITVKSTLDIGELSVVKRSDSLIPDSLIPDSLIPDTRYKEPKKANAKKELDLDFEQSWAIFPKRPGANKAKAFNVWKEKLKAGVDVIEMQRGMYRYSQYCKAMNVESQFIMALATFLGPDEHFLSDWTASASRSKNQDFVDKLIGRNSHDDDFTFDA